MAQIFVRRNMSGIDHWYFLIYTVVVEGQIVIDWWVDTTTGVSKTDTRRPVYEKHLSASAESA